MSHQDIKAGRFTFFRPMLAGATFQVRVIASIGALIGVALTGLITAKLVGNADQSFLLIAPIAASAFLLFVVPSSPMAQPWPIIFGNMISAAIGILCVSYIGWLPLAAGSALALSILMMSATRSLHPPGGAVAMSAVLLGAGGAKVGILYPIIPVAMESIVLVCIGLAFHWLVGNRYPQFGTPATASPQKTADPAPDLRVGLQAKDVEQALLKFEESFDISQEDLTRILRQVQIEASIRSNDKLRCADIMSRDVIAISEKSTPASARALLIDHNIRTLPVVDGDGTLLGTVGLRDILADGDAIKMVKNAVTALESDLVMSIVPFLTDGKNHAVIITDSKRRVVGLITQTDLLNALASIVASKS